MTRQRTSDRFAHRLITLINSCEFEMAAQEAAVVLRRSPAHPVATKVFAIASLKLKHYSDAELYLRAAICQCPADPELHTNLGVCLFELGRHVAALECFKRAIEIAPSNVAAQENLCHGYQRLGMINEALQVTRTALAVQPDSRSLQLQLAVLLAETENHADAAAALAALIETADEDDPVLVGRLAKSLYAMGQYAAADELLSQLRRFYGTGAIDLGIFFMSRMQLAAWTDLELTTSELKVAANARVNRFSPFCTLAAPGLDKNDQLAVATTYAQEVVSSSSENIRAHQSQKINYSADRPLRVGYLSADFHDHATSHLLVGVIESHDRGRFHIFGYSSGPEDGSATSKRIRSAFDRLRDIRSLSDIDAAELIHSDEIDILIDLKGWTKGARMGILAQRPARMQVGWLGYPGTIGSRTLLDYIIGDPVVTPEGEASCYAESVIHLSPCYQPNDNRKPLGATRTRAQEGLRDDQFVFCSFNQVYKLNPNVISVWAKILRQIENGVLWLLASSEEIAHRNLLSELTARGVASDRVIFAKHLPLEEHLARLALADLALDCFPYNSHTTGSDALWAGVPLLTMRGNTFAARVGESLLRAVGLSDFVAIDEDEYVAKATAYCGDTERQELVKKYLITQGRQSDLFDTLKITRRLESLLADTFARHVAD